MDWFSRLFGKPGAEDRPTDRAGDVPEAELAAAPYARASDKRKLVLPRFRGTAADRAVAGTGPLDKTRLRLRSAFTPSQPVMSTSLFAGRMKVLDGLIRSIEDQHLHVIIFGPRGIGKTSTLHVLCSIAEEARYLVRYASCGERTEFDEVFRSILQDIPLLYHENYEPTSDETEDGLSFVSLVTDASLSVAQVSNILAKVSGTRLLIVLDEFDRARSADFRRSIAELIKNLSDRGSRVQLLIAGVAQNLNEIIEHIPSIRRNVLGMQLPNMSEAEIAELIRNGEDASGMTFSAEALTLIGNVALGLPYLASLIAQHAGLAALDRDHQNVERGDVKSAVGLALEEIELRVSPLNLHHVQRAFAAGRERELGLLARVALQQSGRLTIAGVESAVATDAGTEYLRALSSDYGLVAPLADDPAGAYTFVDDGVPLYLWMRLTQHHVLGNIAG